MNNAGNGAFIGFLEHENVVEAAMFIQREDGLAVVVHNGATAPPVDSGIRFDRLVVTHFGLFDFGFNDLGQSVFTSHLSGASVTEMNDTSLWFADQSGTLVLLAREGASAPGMSAEVVFDDFSSETIIGTLKQVPAINAHGDVAFIARTKVPNVNAESSAGIWYGRADALRNLIQTGDTITFGDSQTRIVAVDSGLGSSLALEKSLNDSGQLVFQATIAAAVGEESEKAIILVDSPETRVVLASTAVPALTPEWNFLYFNDHSINNTEQVLFQATIGNETESVGSLWMYSENQVKLIVKDGDIAQSDGSVTFTGISGAVLNDLGQVVFSSLTSDGREGIWGIDADGELLKIIKTGDTIEVAPGDFRSVLRLGAGLGTLNDRGDVAFLAYLEHPNTAPNGALDVGVFTSNVFTPIPEPSSFLLCVLSLFFGLPKNLVR